MSDLANRELPLNTHVSRPEHSWLTVSWLETRPAVNLHSKDRVRRERKRETSVCICETEKVRDTENEEEG